MYGNHEGRTVTEESACKPTAEKPTRRFQAETAWQKAALLQQAHLLILRLSGIYGPHRSALHTQIHKQSQKPETDQMLISRIHVEDILTALQNAIFKTHFDQSWNLSHEPVIINLADDCPATRAQVFQFSQALLDNLPAHRLHQARLASPKSKSSIPSSRQRDRTSKIVSNTKMKQLLLPQLRFPTFREGLLSIAQAL